MKRALSGLAALTLFDIASAHAQAPPVFNWTGFYAGGHAGYRNDQVSATSPYGGFPNVTFGFPGTVSFPVLTTSASHDSGAGVFGLQGGYNLLFAPNFLAGIEADFSGGGERSTTSFTSAGGPLGAVSSNSFTTTIDWSASVRGRLGYVSGPWMLYATAGVSFLNMGMSGHGGYGKSATFGGGDFFTTVSSSSSYSLSKTPTAPVFGGGIEKMLPNNLLVRAEYLFADYGTVNFGNALIVNSYSDNNTCHCTVSSITSGTPSAHVVTQTVRLGLSVKIP
jgi:outer membrane immunogenic protein